MTKRFFDAVGSAVGLLLLAPLLLLLAIVVKLTPDRAEHGLDAETGRVLRMRRKNFPNLTGLHSLSNTYFLLVTSCVTSWAAWENATNDFLVKRFSACDCPWN